MNVDISKWAHRNLWVTNSGELAVRPGLNLLQSPESGRTLCASWSVQNSRTGEAWHYVVDVDSSERSPVLRVYDEDFLILQTLALQANVRPRVVTYCVVEGQLVVASPDFPTLWGQVGTSLVRMTQGTSEIDGRTLVDPPRGIAVSWAGRTVIAADNLVYFSDPLFPRVFDPANIVNPPGGPIYGLHVSMAGSLIICTTDGVYSLAVQAAASGQIVLGVWQKMTDFGCFNYGTTAHSRGILYGLTQKGYRRIDQEGSEEIFLDDPRVGVAGTNPSQTQASFPDYRKGRLYGGERGPIISIGGLVRMVDLESGVSAWWQSAFGVYELTVVGLMYETDGSELLVAEGGILRLYGTMEGNDDTVIVSGSRFGLVPVPADVSPVVRSVDFATDAGQVAIFLNATDSPQVNVPITGSTTAVIGTSSYGSSIYTESAFHNKRFKFAERNPNIAIQVRAYGSGFRLASTLAIAFRGPGKKRQQ